MMRPALATWFKARWGDGYACPHCGTAGEPFHFENRPGVLRCRKCRHNTGLTVGTVMERSHTPIERLVLGRLPASPVKRPACPPCSFSGNLVFRATRRPYEFSTSSAREWCCPTKTGSVDSPRTMSEVAETWVGGRTTSGEGRGVHHKVPVSCAIEVRHRKPGTKLRQPERRTLCRTRKARRRARP